MAIVRNSLVQFHHPIELYIASHARTRERKRGRKKEKEKKRETAVLPFSHAVYDPMSQNIPTVNGHSNIYVHSPLVLVSLTFHV